MLTSQLSECSKLGEPDPTYGQVYWGKTNDSLTPVKFNSKNEHIGVGDTIEYEERAEKQSSKGTMYYQLKKVRVVSQISVPLGSPPATPQSGSNAQLDRIEANQQEIMSRLDDLLGKNIPDELK